MFSTQILAFYFQAERSRKLNLTEILSSRLAPIRNKINKVKVRNNYIVIFSKLKW